MSDDVVEEAAAWVAPVRVSLFVVCLAAATALALPLRSERQARGDEHPPHVD